MIPYRASFVTPSQHYTPIAIHRHTVHALLFTLGCKAYSRRELPGKGTPIVQRGQVMLAAKIEISQMQLLGGREVLRIHDTASGNKLGYAIRRNNSALYALRLEGNHIIPCKDISIFHQFTVLKDCTVQDPGAFRFEAFKQLRVPLFLRNGMRSTRFAKASSNSQSRSS